MSQYVTPTSDKNKKTFTDNVGMPLREWKCYWKATTNCGRCFFMIIKKVGIIGIIHGLFRSRHEP